MSNAAIDDFNIIACIAESLFSDLGLPREHPQRNA